MAQSQQDMKVGFEVKGQKEIAESASAIKHVNLAYVQEKGASKEGSPAIL